MDFLDRENEMRRLSRSSADPDGGLVVVWGRRRIGKTRLLLEWVERTGGLYWVADESAAPLQRRYLAETLELKLPGFGNVEYRDWSSLFDRLARDAKAAGWRGPIVFDELPYVLGSSPELPSTLQRFVDHGARSARLTIALAGSSQRMMQGLALDPNAPLYGRAREIIKLQPLGAAHLRRALRMDNPLDVVAAWSAWGGVPRYWELASHCADLRDAVDSLVLDPQGPLHEEPARLLLEEMPPAIALRPLLDAIGSGAHRVSEIAARVGQPATSLSRPLTRLQELDLVHRDLPFGEPERSSKRALYKISDPFLRLWFTVVASKRSVLLQVPRKARLRIFDQARPRLCSMAWEDLCRAAVPHLWRALGAEFGPARRYWAGNGPEWDAVAEAEDGTLLLGEVKWFDREPSAKQIGEAVGALLAKGVPPVRSAKGGRVTHVLFVPIVPRGSRDSAHVKIIDAAMVLAAST